MKNSKVKHISIITILLIVTIALVYGIYLRSQPTTQADLINTQEEEQPKVKVEDIENNVTIDVPEIKINETEQAKEDQDQEHEITLEVEKPTVPPKPEPPKEERHKEEATSNKANTDNESIPKDKDEVQNGDEENSNPPKYEEPPKAKESEEEPVKNPVVVTPETPKDTSEDKGDTVVPDSENPFLKPPSEVPSNGDRGERDSSDYGDGEWGTGDKF